jgi:hypothetical protein
VFTQGTDGVRPRKSAIFGQPAPRRAEKPRLLAEARPSGGWTSEQKDAMAIAYYDALPATRIANYDRQTYLTDLEYCRLHQAVQWLGWSPFWSPPPEHAQDWLKEALQSAELLNI